MTEIERIERRVQELTSTFDLRPTLERAADIGDLLIEARSIIGHGGWATWLARQGLHRRTVWDYIAVARSRDGNVWPATQMTIKAFLTWVRRAKNVEREAEREEARNEARRAQGALPDTIMLAHADCREYAWPRAINLAVCDPPWSEDLAHYEWIATWAAKNLRDGGLALVQCGQHLLPHVMTILGNRLNYLWTMSIAYSESSGVVAKGKFRNIWKPVLVYAKGKAVIPETVSDMYLMHVVGTEKVFHPWEQPIAPWRYWLSRLSKPGELAGDPYAGSGTIALVCHDLGLRYVGTEADRKTFRVARGRICQAGRLGQSSPRKEVGAKR